MVYFLIKTFICSFFIVLSRVQAFLPRLEASNAILAQRARDDPNSIDIEHIPDGMDQYIEMVSFMLYLRVPTLRACYRILVLAYSKIAPIRILSAMTTVK